MPSSAAQRRDDETASRKREQAPWSEGELGPCLQLGSKRLRIRLAIALLVLAAVPGIAGGAPRMAFSAAVVLSAVLLHELGHALWGLLCRRRVDIVLHVLGTHTSFEPRLPKTLELFAIASGPVLSLVAGLLACWLEGIFPRQHWLNALAWVNLAWGGVNLLPVLPFDTGRALLMLLGDRRRATALLISGSFSLVIAMEGLFVLRYAPLFFVFGAAALASLLSWVNQRRIEHEAALGLPEQLAQAEALLRAGQAEQARRLATRVAVRALRNDTANSAWETIAWAELELDRPERAQLTLSRIRPAGRVSQHCLAAVYAARGREREAIAILERTRRSEQSSAESIKLLIDLYVRRGSLDRACAVAGAELSLLTPDDTRRVVQAAFAAGATLEASHLAGLLFALTGDPDDAAGVVQAAARSGRKLTALARSSAS